MTRYYKARVSKVSITNTQQIIANESLVLLSLLMNYLFSLLQVRNNSAMLKCHLQIFTLVTSNRRGYSKPVSDRIVLKRIFVQRVPSFKTGKLISPKRLFKEAILLHQFFSLNECLLGFRTRFLCSYRVSSLPRKIIG